MKTQSRPSRGSIGTIAVRTARPVGEILLDQGLAVGIERLGVPPRDGLRQRASGSGSGALIEPGSAWMMKG